MKMKEAIKGCITRTSQLSLKVARPKCITVIQEGWGTQDSNKLSSECRSYALFLKLMNE
jgi:hypothetical protein